MTSAYEYPSLLGQTLFDTDGEALGTVDEVYVDEGGQPRWAGVATGWFGTRVHVVPLDGVTSTGDGFKVRCTKDEVADAPDVRLESPVDPELERLLADHYGTAAPAPAPSPEPAAGDHPGAPSDVVANSGVEAGDRVQAETSDAPGTVAQHDAHQHDGVPHPVDQA